MAAPPALPPRPEIMYRLFGFIRYAPPEEGNSLPPGLNGGVCRAPGQQLAEAETEGETPSLSAERSLAVLQPKDL